MIVIIVIMMVLTSLPCKVQYVSVILELEE